MADNLDLSPSMVIRTLESLRGSRLRMYEHLRLMKPGELRKRKIRDSERAMSLAAYAMEAEALRVAIERLTNDVDPPDTGRDPVRE